MRNLFHYLYAKNKKAEALYLCSLIGNVAFEQHHRKPALACVKTKTQISCTVTAQLISAFVFTTYIVQSVYFLNCIFHASSHLLWLYRTVCVEPIQNPEDWFSHDAAHFILPLASVS